MQNHSESATRVARPAPSPRAKYLRRRIRERLERRREPAITLLPDGSLPRARE
jgi:hypothetical protein